MKRAIVVVCSWAAALCLAAAYLAIGWGIDDIAGRSAWSTWWIGVLGALGSGVFAWAVSALGAAQMNQMEPALRHSMIRQVFALGPSQRTNERAGRVVNSATDGVERVAAYKGIFLAPMIASLTTPILVVIVVAMMIDPASGGFLAIAIMSGLTPGSSRLTPYDAPAAARQRTSPGRSARTRASSVCSGRAVAMFCVCVMHPLFPGTRLRE